MIRKSLIAFCLAAAIASPAFADPDPYPLAVLQVLDKVTGKTFKVTVPLNRAVPVGLLQITARACYKNAPEDAPESAAFLEIKENKSSLQDRDLFSGWMFASSPSLSALEHPIYDVLVLDCSSGASKA